MEEMRRRFLAVGVCLAVLFCSLASVRTVDAASRTAKVTVSYKGKNVIFETVRSPGKSNVKFTLGAKTYAAIKKAWGKADEVEKIGNVYNYTWKSGKTSVWIRTYKNKRKGPIAIEIQNKKAALCGIKVGMSKKQTLQKLRNQFGKENVSVKKNEILVQVGPFTPMIFELKSGKVKSISYWHS